MIKDAEEIKQEKVKNIAFQYYSHVLKGGVNQDKIKVSPLMSLTNDVYKVSGQNLQTILIKMYQSQLPQFADSTLEVRLVSRLGDQKYYPVVLYENPHYRIEEFVDSVSFTPKTLNPKLVLQIVKYLASFSCSYKQLVLEYNQSNNIRPKFQFNQLQETFWKIYERKRKDCPEQVKNVKQSIEKTFGNQEIMKKLTKVLSQTERVLSHNDLHLGNVLLRKGQGERVYLLDFQFCQFNYLGFDIGNFLNQWSTFYGERQFQIKEDQQMEQDLKEQVISTYFTSMKLGYAFRNSKAYIELYVQLGRVMSHIFWLVIGLKQIDDKRIGFSMTYYIRRRYQEFSKHYRILEKMLVTL